MSVDIHLLNQDSFTLRSDRLLLRPPTLDDADGLFKHTSDARITTYLAWEPHSTLEMAKGLIGALIEGQKNDKGYHWMVFKGTTLIGLISLIDVRRKHRTWTINRAELSYWVGIDFQGMGFATEASKLVLDFAFKHLSFHKIVLGHVPDNPASGIVAQRLGFQMYGNEKDAFYKNQRWYNMCWYELIYGGI